MTRFCPVCRKYMGGVRMIKIRKVSKNFDDIRAVNNTDLTVPDACIFGLLGTNGAGKSTLLRLMSGVLKPDEGSILIDAGPVWDAPKVKEKFFYISDDQFFFANANVFDMADFYQMFYPDFDRNRFAKMLKILDLDPKRKISTFSKGMKKQLSILLGISSNASYLLCDETFDGLDPVVRQGIKSLFAREMDERGLTVVIASHNLRELEDICDHIGLLHKGGVLLSKDLDDLRCNLTKVQCVLAKECDEQVKGQLEMLHFERRGRLITFTCRGREEDVLKSLEEFSPVFCEALPLSLEEIFISETEVAGYDFKSLIS